MCGSAATDGLGWDWNIISALFNSADQEKIACLPLNIRQVKDCLVWIHDKKGVHSVKSGYHSIHAGNRVEISDELRGFWKHFWKQKVVPKVLNLCWRACTGCLPVKELLWSRRVCNEEACPCCGSACETVLHTLVEYARCVVKH